MVIGRTTGSEGADADLGADAAVRQRAIGFFKLVRDFMQLRFAPPLNVDRYEASLWFDQIPENERCFVRPRDDSNLHDDEIWLQIDKWTEPALPPVPGLLEPWLPSPLTQQDEIEPTPHSELGYPTVRRLVDEPQLGSLWEAYLAEAWRPWSIEHQRWRAHQETYKELFAIHQSQLRQGEEYELVVGVGLLCWRTPDDRHVRRHVVTMPVSLEFSAATGALTVGLPPDGLKLSAETDMLEPGERPEGFEESVVAANEELEESPWADKEWTALLRKAANAIADGNGEYDPRFSPIAEGEAKPRIVFAPALIFRKRSINLVMARFEKVVQSLEAGGEIPPNVGLLSGAEAADAAPVQHDESAGVHDEESVLFPLPANQEQIRIIEKLRRGAGVLVQGPPGTGKSHTIANLICQLLAEGKSMLVTAQTARALRVLREKLPAEIKPLCLSVLGNDRAAMDELKRSVEVILNRQQRQDSGRERIKPLSERLDQLYRHRAEIDGQLRAIREAETQIIEIPGTGYRGTAQAIAERLSDEEAGFSWFEDRPGPETIRAAPADFIRFRSLTIAIDVKRVAELKKGFPRELDKAAEIERLRQIVEQEQIAERRFKELHDAGQAANSALDTASFAQAKQVRDALGQVAAIAETVRRRTAKWVERAVRDVLTDQDAPWKERHSVVHELVAAFAPLARAAERRQVVRPEGVHASRLQADAEDLRKHLDAGGGVHIVWWLRSSVVRRSAYLTKRVRIDGRLCADRDRLSELLEVLEAERLAERLWEYVADLEPRVAGPLRLQAARLREHLEDLEQLVALDAALRAGKGAVAGVMNLAEPDWTDHDMIQRVIRRCELRMAELRVRECGRQIKAIESGVADMASSPDVHPVVPALLRAIQERDVSDYRAQIEALRKLQEDVASLAQRTELQVRLEQSCPATVAAIVADPASPQWDARLIEVDRAHQWASAQSWLHSYEDERHDTPLRRQFDRLQEEIASTRAELSSNRAWDYCLRRMSRHHREHLSAWQLATKKIGAGTGKYAARHKAVAQRMLAECRDAVPAWVLPLYRVYEQIDPSPGMFDVVIIDEASQCSLDALMLLYLGKTLIIVGDDEQISPTVIVENQQLFDLIRRHLPGKSLAEVITPETSLFDLGRIWFEDVVSLREHFRCVPEIINFSNGLCYHNQLLPLKQYPPDRLEPIRTEFVRDGYRRGKGSASSNPPEAQRIAEAVVSCCKDPRYDGKTMGVISLLGDGQARLIEKLLLERLTPEEIVQKRQLICGDAYSFQGDERDVMFLSLVAAASGEDGDQLAMRALADKKAKQRFNVAASRAREQMWLFHSVELPDLGNPQDMRRLLLEYCLNPQRSDRSIGDISLIDLRQLAVRGNRAMGEQPPPFESWFEIDVYLHLRERGYAVIPQFDVAGYRIDLVVFEGDRMLAVECDGDQWHGIERYDDDVKRQRQLERSGWHFWRVRGSEFYADQQGSLSSLWQELHRRKIRPEDARTRSSERERPIAASEQASAKPQEDGNPTMPVAVSAVTMEVAIADDRSATLGSEQIDLRQSILFLLSKSKQPLSSLQICQSLEIHDEECLAILDELVRSGEATMTPGRRGQMFSFNR